LTKFTPVAPVYAYVGRVDGAFGSGIFEISSSLVCCENCASLVHDTPVAVAKHTAFHNAVSTALGQQV